MLENIFCMSVFHDLSCIHNCNIVCNICNDSQVMSDHDHGSIVLFLDILDQIQDLRLHSHIQRCGRLIRKDNFRVSGQRHRQHSTLRMPPEN